MKRFSMNIFFEKIRWEVQKRELLECGENTRMAEGFILNGAKSISLGSNVDCAPNTELSVWKSCKNMIRLEIQNNVKMAPNCMISCINYLLQKNKRPVLKAQGDNLQS